MGYNKAMKGEKRLHVAGMLAIVALATGPRPARALDNPLTVDLRGASSHLQEAAATIFGSGSNMLVDVTHYRGVLNGAAVTLNAGSCKRPGRICF